MTNKNDWEEALQVLRRWRDHYPDGDLRTALNTAMAGLNILISFDIRPVQVSSLLYDIMLGGRRFCKKADGRIEEVDL
jgi:hypothetical protein